MKYTSEISISLPREKVLELFTQTDSLKKWQPGLKSFEHLEGEPGEVGCRTRMVYAGRKSDLIITENITKKQLPEQIHMSYKSRGVHNEIENWFTEEKEGITLWRTENTFRFSGVMMLMVPFMKNAFIHNTLLNMDHFKLFAENPERI